MPERLVPERLAWPLSVAADGRLATVEQDSGEDIELCARAILLHRVGERSDVPEMGVPDLAFSEQPVDVDGVLEVLERHEPRITVLATQAPDALEQLVADVRLEWDRRPQIESEE